MDDSQGTKRRWFRFRLSTVLILTAIAAWGMACWPWVLTTERLVYPWGGGVNDFIPPDYWYGRELPPLTPKKVHSINWQLGWPSLALIVFIIGKAAWAVVERRRRLSAASE